MSSLLLPVKDAFGRWMTAFHRQFFADTSAGVEWKARPTSLAISWSAGRMVDDVDAMLKSYRTNSNLPGPSSTAKLPVMFVALAREYTDTPGDAGRPMLSPMAVELPGDPDHRSLRARVRMVDLRAQLVAIASDPSTAFSMIAQADEWTKTTPSMKQRVTFQGLVSEWPVTVFGQDRMAIAMPDPGQMTGYALDLTLRAALVMLSGPGEGDATDGNEPPGFAVTTGFTAGYSPLVGGAAGAAVANSETLPSGSGASSVVLREIQ